MTEHNPVLIAAVALLALGLAVFAVAVDVQQVPNHPVTHVLEVFSVAAAPLAIYVYAR